MTFFDIFSKKKIKEKQKPKIIIDNREKNSLVPSILQSIDMQIEFKQLPVADYIINNIAIERKTIQDLKSSIINKRILTQLVELKQYPQHFLIIEGNKESLYGPPLHENAIRGFLLSTVLENDIPIIFTNDEKDTALYLSTLAKKQKKSPSSFRPFKTIKTDEGQIQFILEGFPNIGPVKSKQLIERFKSLKNIINATTDQLQPILGKRTSEFRSLIEKETGQEIFSS